MGDYHVVLGAIGVLVGLAGYSVYLRDIARGTIKPHAFSWLGWGLMNTTVFLAQFVSGAGAGAWVTFLTTFICFLIAYLAFLRGEKNITKFDWVCLGGVLCGIVLWIFTREPLSAVIIVTVTDFIAYVPTIRKAYHKPHEESALSFGIAVFRSLFSILALESFAMVNWLYPASLMLSDGGFTAMLLFRRRQLAVNAESR